MNMGVYEGFTIYKNSEGPVFVTLHSGPAIETPTSRDDNADTVASQCWIKSGGSLVLANLTRKRTMGVDFNREAPPLSKAINAYREFVKDEDAAKLRSYRAKYAWVAVDEKDHYERLRIYDNLWFQLKNLGNFFIFVHRKFTRLRNYPSIMDVSCFKGMGVKKEIVEKIVNDVNQKYLNFFISLESEYKEAILLEQKRVLKRVGKLKLSKINNPITDFDEHISEDFNMIKKNAELNIVKKLEKNTSHTNFFLGAKNALKNIGPPKITLEKIFVGDLSHAPRNKFYLREMSRDKIVLEIECNQFMNYWYPDVASRIIIDIIGGIKTAEMYRRMGHKQTEIMKYINGSE